MGPDSPRDTGGVTTIEAKFDAVLLPGNDAQLVGTKHAHADAETVTEYRQ